MLLRPDARRIELGVVLLRILLVVADVVQCLLADDLLNPRLLDGRLCVRLTTWGHHRVSQGLLDLHQSLLVLHLAELALQLLVQPSDDADAIGLILVAGLIFVVLLQQAGPTTGSHFDLLGGLRRLQHLPGLALAL